MRLCLISFVLVVYLSSYVWAACNPIYKMYCDQLCRGRGCSAECPNDGQCNCKDCKAINKDCTATHLKTCNDHCTSKECSQAMCTGKADGGFRCMCNGCTPGFVGGAGCDSKGETYCKNTCNRQDCADGRCSGKKAGQYECTCTKCKESGSASVSSTEQCSKSDETKCQNYCDDKDCKGKFCSKPGGRYKCQCFTCKSPGPEPKPVDPCSTCAAQCKSRGCSRNSCEKQGSGLSRCQCTSCGGLEPPKLEGNECSNRDDTRCKKTCDDRECPTHQCAIKSGMYQCQCRDCTKPQFPQPKPSSSDTTCSQSDKDKCKQKCSQKNCRTPSCTKSSGRTNCQCEGCQVTPRSSNKCSSSEEDRCKRECTGKRCSRNSCSKRLGRYKCDCQSCSSSSSSSSGSSAAVRRPPSQTKGCDDYRQGRCKRYCENKRCSGGSCKEISYGTGWACPCTGC